MIKRKIAPFGLAFVLLFISMGFACNKEDKTRTLAKAEDDIAQAQLGVAKFLADAKSTSTLSQEDIDAIKPFLIEVNNANGEAIRITKELLANPSAEKKAQLLAAVNVVSGSIIRLNTAGTLRIKDPQKRLVFNGLVTALQGAVSAAVIVLIKN